MSTLQCTFVSRANLWVSCPCQKSEPPSDPERCLAVPGMLWFPESGCWRLGMTALITTSGCSSPACLAPIIPQQLSEFPLIPLASAKLQGHWKPGPDPCWADGDKSNEHHCQWNVCAAALFWVSQCWGFAFRGWAVLLLPAADPSGAGCDPLSPCPSGGEVMVGHEPCSCWCWEERRRSRFVGRVLLTPTGARRLCEECRGELVSSGLKAQSCLCVIQGHLPGSVEQASWVLDDVSLSLE